MASLDKPNLILPLALTFNERDTLGYTSSFTNGRDQQKKNMFYEIAKNPLTQKGTLTLSKRPGVTIDADTFGAVSSQAAYLVISDLGKGAASGDNPIVFSTATIGTGQTNGTIIASNSASTATVHSASSAAGLVPAFVDRTNLSGVENIVLQLRGISNAVPQRVFYGTAVNSWTEIADSDFTGVNHRGKMEHLDGYALYMDSTNKVWNTDLNSLASVGAASFVTKAATQDIANGLIKFKNQIIAMGDDTAEPFFNAGNASGSPLTRIPQLNDRVGLSPCNAWQTAGTKATHYYAIVQNRAYFVGRRGGGQKSIGLFSYDGSRYEKVSPSYIDKMLSENESTFLSVNNFGFYGQQAVAIELSFAAQWLMFFPDWKDWFIWTSTTFRPVTNGTFFLSSGATNQGRIYSYTTANNYQDNEVNFSAEAAFKIPTNGYHLKRIPMWGVEADTDTSANNLTVRYSDDDTSSYGAFGTIDLTLQKKVKYRGGAFMERHIQLVSNNARPVRLHNFIATIK